VALIYLSKPLTTLLGNECGGAFCELMESNYEGVSEPPENFVPFRYSPTENADGENSIEALSLSNSVCSNLD
jgi:hypothetical protein